MPNELNSLIDALEAAARDAATTRHESAEAYLKLARSNLLDHIADLAKAESQVADVLVFVNMQKRGDGRVYCDLHKTDARIYFDAEDAQRGIDADPELARHRHVVGIVARLARPEELAP